MRLVANLLQTKVMSKNNIKRVDKVEIPFSTFLTDPKYGAYCQEKIKVVLKNTTWFTSETPEKPFVMAYVNGHKGHLQFTIAVDVGDDRYCQIVDTTTTKDEMCHDQFVCQAFKWLEDNNVFVKYHIRDGLHFNNLTDLSLNPTLPWDYQCVFLLKNLMSQNILQFFKDEVSGITKVKPYYNPKILHAALQELNLTEAVNSIKNHVDPSGLNRNKPNTLDYSIFDKNSRDRIFAVIAKALPNEAEKYKRVLDTSFGLIDLYVQRRSMTKDQEDDLRANANAIIAKAETFEKLYVKDKYGRLAIKYNQPLKGNIKLTMPLINSVQMYSKILAENSRVSLNLLELAPDYIIMYGKRHKKCGTYLHRLALYLHKEKTFTPAEFDISCGKSLVNVTYCDADIKQKITSKLIPPDRA